MAPSMGPGMDPDQSRSVRGRVADAQEPWCVRALQSRAQSRNVPSVARERRVAEELSVEAAVGSDDEDRCSSVGAHWQSSRRGWPAGVRSVRPSAERGLERSAVQETPRTEARCDVCLKGNPAAPSPTARIFSATRIDGKVPPHRPISAMVLGETRDSGGKRSQES